MDHKKADTDHPILDLIATRWSPRAFADKAVAPEELRALFEAARWAASCYNDQPWHYMIATKDDPEEYARILDCLMPMNQQWAKHAPVLMISVARTDFSHNNKPNRHAWHDMGQAIATLTVQAQSQGLFVHQMAGFSPKKAREHFTIPQGFEPVAAAAIGYPGDPDILEGDFKEFETAPRERKPITDFVFTGSFGTKTNIFD